MNVMTAMIAILYLGLKVARTLERLTSIGQGGVELIKGGFRVIENAPIACLARVMFSLTAINTYQTAYRAGAQVTDRVNSS